MYSILPNRRVYTFISGQVCLLGSIKVKRQTWPEINVYTRLFGTIEYRQNIAGHCQQTFCVQKFVDNNQQSFALTPFQSIIGIFTEGDGIKSSLSS